MIVFYASVLERSLWKYTDRGYRYVLFEAGHVAQNVNLVVESLGLGSLNLGGFLDDQIAALLELDMDEEVPLMELRSEFPLTETGLLFVVPKPFGTIKR